MNKVKLNIWNRNFNLDIYLESFCNTPIKEEQENIYEKFIKNKKSIDDALTEICIYIEKNYTNQLINGKIDNIFKYILPKTIYVPNDCEFVALLCDFKFDIEHGIAIVFDKKNKITISSQDEIL